MAQFITNLKETFKRGNIYIQLIYINVGVFILTSLFEVFMTLFKLSASPILHLFDLPASVTKFATQPWSLITYMFMHAGFMHILFNMLWLYWFGSLFLYFFSSKHLRGLYILGGLCGGILYMLAYNIFPYFQGSIDFSFLLGASASVLAIVIATAYREPNYKVNLLFLGAIRLKYIAAFMVITDLIFITSDNGGGHIAHLGGALAGLWFAIALNKGHDITSWINHVLDWVSGLFNFRRHKSNKKAKMRVHYGSRTDEYDYNARKKTQSDEIDRILDKLKKSGYENLTTDEKKSLFDASRK